jgi:hypothetical protein
MTKRPLLQRDVKKNLSLRLERLRALVSRLEITRSVDHRSESLIEELRVAIADVRHARALVGGPFYGDARVENPPEASFGA